MEMRWGRKSVEKMVPPLPLLHFQPDNSLPGLSNMINNNVSHFFFIILSVFDHQSNRLLAVQRVGLDGNPINITDSYFLILSDSL